MKRTLKEHRAHKLLSQQELSDLSGVSVRTIQRVEKDPSSVSPYVTRSLCRALEIGIGQLETNSTGQMDFGRYGRTPQRSKEKGPNVETDGGPRLKYINFSSMAVLLLPFSNLVFPTILYLVHRKSLSRPDRKAAHRLLSFQILWFLATLFLVIFIPVPIGLVYGVGEIGEVPLFIWIYLMSVAIHMAISLDTAIKLDRSIPILTYIPNIL